MVARFRADSAIAKGRVAVPAFAFQWRPSIGSLLCGIISGFTLGVVATFIWLLSDQ